MLKISLFYIMSIMLLNLMMPTWGHTQTGADGGELSRLMDLRGQWKFSIGDNIEWKEVGFSDDTWEKIFIPSAWEDEGYPGYDGYAWYRKKFDLEEKHRNKMLYLRLGFIDDVDEVYLNGHFIGFTGQFPPEYYTGYHLERIYKIHDEFWNYGGENVIAVRVFDKELSGGIIRGQVGVYELDYGITIEVSLQGIWKFASGDDMKRKDSDFSDWDWKDVMVPAQWETQGFRDYDGFGWYRKKFFMPEKLKNQNLVLLLGKIDDLDESYINGKFVGKTGDMEALDLFIENEWLEFRGYRLENSDIRFGAENVLAVRVYDGLVQGGIYQGPIGITTEERYERWKYQKKGRKGIFEFLFNN
jgi:sialate O-acetylesterase